MTFITVIKQSKKGGVTTFKKFEMCTPTLRVNMKKCTLSGLWKKRYCSVVACCPPQEIETKNLGKLTEKDFCVLEKLTFLSF